MISLLVIAIAIESFIGKYDNVLFWLHMIQHLLLVMIAGGLAALGAPIDLLRSATSGKLGKYIESTYQSRIAQGIFHPITAMVIYAASIPITHLTSIYNDTLRYESLHDLEHVFFIVVGYLFWRPVIGIEGIKLSPAIRLAYLALAVPVDTFTGMALVLTKSEIFPYYLSFHRSWGPSLVSDLHDGGAAMWVGGDFLMFLAMLPVAFQWARLDEIQAKEMDRILDAADSEIPWL